MLQRIFSTLAVIAFLLLGSVAMAADNSSVLGGWNMELDLQGHVFALDLTITDTEEGLAGTISAAEFPESPISNVTFDGETLKFDADDQQGGVAKVSLKLANNELKGSIVAAMGDIPAVATRK